MRPKGSAEELERRRFRAVELMERGESPAVISRILGVSIRSLSQWRARGGTEALRAKPASGRPARLSDDDVRELERLLLQGATGHGWPNDFWTCRRGGEIVRRRFGVEYHPSYVSVLLRERLNWTPQRPEHRHINRDDAEIAAWASDVFPLALRNAEARSADVVFVDEAGFQLEPTVRRTYAPRGKTPIHRVAGPHARISVIAAIVLTPRGGRVSMEYGMLGDNVNFRWPAVLQFVRSLRSKRSRPMTVCWDQIAIHTCPSLREQLAADPGIAVEPFPPYAPELNPADGIWRYIKNDRIPNYTPPSLDILREKVTAELDRIRGSEDLLKGFVRFTGLPVNLE